MSTIIVIQKDDGIYLVTDAGQYDPHTGNLVKIRSKVHIMDSGVVFAWRGSGGDWSDIIAAELSAVGDFDSTVAAIPEMAANLLRDGTKESATPMPAGGWVMELWVAGNSAGLGRPHCVWLTSESAPVGAKALPPFTVRDAPAFAMFPAPAEQLHAILGRQITGENLETLDPVGEGLALIEAQRRTPSAQGWSVAGGRAELTCVWPAETVHYVLRDWGDEIGKPVSTG